MSLFCGIGGIFGVPGILYADDIQLPHVTVFGTATTSVTPDTMVWSLTVKNIGSDLQKVAKQHNRLVESVLKFLKKKKKVDKQDIQTAMMEFGENWEYKNKTRIKEGYYSSTSISFKLKKFDKYKELWIGLSAKENVSVDNVPEQKKKTTDSTDIKIKRHG
ncbi:MAG: SIMPL domain-containing protein [bacterium]|nr:SIMPL domain-containing protein [bacterium]